MGTKAIKIGLGEKDIPRLNPATIDAACYAGELQAFIVKPTHLHPFFTMTNKGLPRRRRPPIGERRIRTFEGDNQQIYSLPPLAAWVPLPVKRQTYSTIQAITPFVNRAKGICPNRFLTHPRSDRYSCTRCRLSSAVEHVTCNLGVVSSILTVGFWRCTSVCRFFMFRRDGRPSSRTLQTVQRNRGMIPRRIPFR